MVYSTKLKKDRYLVPCVVMTSSPAVHMFVVDTGARYTCCSIYNIYPNYQEDDFQKAEYKHIGGIVEGGIIN